jgi:parvulin-like peptidyl-prolyl isomerase
MTFRARPVDRIRAGRDPNRRNFYMNVGFGAAVIIAVVILVVVAGTTWYNSHLAPAATVDGVTINKDQFAERIQVEVWRLQQQKAEIQAEVQAGRLTQAQASAQANQLDQQLQSKQYLPTILEKMIDGQLLAKLAPELGVSVTPQQIDAAIDVERTRKELRHAWVIAVKPVVADGATEPTEQAKTDAKKKATDALAEIKAGTKTFEDVAKAISDDATKTDGGDLGWIKPDAAEDEAWRTAVFKLDKGGLTDVIEGADGFYRIGKVTDIAPAEVDQAWLTKLADFNIKVDTYRRAVESETLRKAIEDKLVADETKAGPQRQVDELFIQEGMSTGSKAIKTRHILYRPQGDSASSDTVPDDDPRWAEAQAKAQKAYDTIKADPSKFDSIARAESNEEPAKGDDGSGGKLPYFDETSQIDDAFAEQIFKDGLQPGDLIPPFKSSFGWHVVQVMYRPPDIDEMTKLRDQIVGGADFATVVRDFSEGPKQTKSGDIGWVINGQLDARLTRAIFAAPKGGLSEIVTVKGDGIYLFKIVDEKTGDPDKDQIDAIKNSAYQNWFAEKKDAAKITRDAFPS